MNDQLDKFIDKNSSILCGALSVFTNPETAVRYETLRKSDYSFEEICRDAFVVVCYEARNLAAEPNEWEENAFLPIALAEHQDLLDRLGNIAHLCGNHAEEDAVNSSIIDLVGEMPIIVRQSVEAHWVEQDQNCQSDHQSDRRHPEQTSFQISGSTLAHPMPTGKDSGPVTPPAHGYVLGAHRVARGSVYSEGQAQDSGRPGQVQIPAQRRVKPNGRPSNLDAMLEVWTKEDIRLIRKDNSAVLGRLPQGGAVNILVVMKKQDPNQGVAIIDGDRYDSVRSLFYGVDEFIFMQGLIRVTRKGRISDPGELQVSGIGNPAARGHVLHALKTKKHIKFV
ncbi:hypothetical protein [Streptomyces cinereoruber]|uniref:hypothetical protein n=1 Tax=Streptomyces cinereoruber TaxID=67260 RepID=UPI003657988A